MMRTTQLARLACLGGLAALAACAAPAGTAIELDVGYDESWRLTALAVRGADNASSIAPRRKVRILVPEAWGATTIKFDLRGMRGDTVRARGSVTVTPIADRTVSAPVALALVPCGAWCVAGATTCTGDGVSVCEQRDDDQCFEWSDPVPCGGAAPYCSLGTCLASCVDECADGEVRCAGPEGVQRCGHADSDSCRDWQPVEPCPEGTCSAGHCAATCDDECALGATRCVNGGVARCGDLDGDDCTEWSPVEPCPGASCSAGACQATCSDDCTAATCAGLTHHACGQFDLDACRDVSPGVSCVPAEDCMEGACSPAAGCASAPTVCDAPPAAMCVDADTLRTFQPAGTCSADECSYPFVDARCDDGCSAGRCNCPSSTCTSELLAGGQRDSYDLLVDDTHLYWRVTDLGQGYLVRMPKAGGTVEVFTRGAESAGALAMDDKHVYWPDVSVNTLMRLDKITRTSVSVAAAQFVWSPAVDDTHVYWSGRSGDSSFIERRAKTGGSIETVMAQIPLVIDIAVNASHVFWITNDEDLRVWRRGKSGGVVENVATQQQRVSEPALHVDADHVYWLALNTIWRLPVNLSGPIETFGTGAVGTQFWLDDTHVYWARRGRIARKPKAGGPVDETASLANPVAVTRDATHVYYIDDVGIDNQIRRVSACGCGF